MRIRFDRVIPELLRICETTPHFIELKKACLVRDLRGRVRLVLQADPTKPSLDRQALEKALEAELQGYFAPPILSTDSDNKEEKHLANNIVKLAQAWPESWPSEYTDTITATRRKLQGPWCSFQRVLSKESWLLPQKVALPWPFVSKAKTKKPPPHIVSFYSFKGGVGRTLLVAAMAWHAARAGQRVAVIDLDLEAPGLDVLLAATSERGVIDFLLDHCVTGSADLVGCYGVAAALEETEAARIYVFPAGEMSFGYIEKLARLDYVSTGPKSDVSSPVGEALKELLLAIRDELKPDLILLDSRAGLHDLGGISLHALAHVDVLVSRAGDQAYRGMNITLQALTRRRAESDLLCILVHSMASPADTPEGHAEREEFKQTAYNTFSELVYGEDAPPIDDSTVSHFPWVISRRDELYRANRLSPAELEPVFFSAEFAALFQRIQELCSTDDGDASE